MTLETGQNVLLNVEEELRPEVELVPTLLLSTVDLIVWEIVPKLGNATPKVAKVKHFKDITVFSLYYMVK